MTYTPDYVAALAYHREMFAFQQKKGTIYDAAVAYAEWFLPLLGHMLLRHGFAHADAHSGNLRYDAKTKTFWIIDWGAIVRFDEERRQALCDLVNELSIGETSSLDVSWAERSSKLVCRDKSIELAFWQR